MTSKSLIKFILFFSIAFYSVAAQAQTAIYEPDGPAKDARLNEELDKTNRRLTEIEDAKGGTPALSSCGTSPLLTTNSKDYVGSVTVGTGTVTSCTIKFSKSKNNTIVCRCQDKTDKTFLYCSASSTEITIGDGSTNFNSDLIDYLCSEFSP